MRPPIFVRALTKPERDRLGAGQRRDDPAGYLAARRPVEAGQAVDHQPGSRVRTKKSARDRLIRLAASHPTWALGFQDEVGWSRLARPGLRTWVEEDHRLRLVEQVVAKDDPDPKALACYGLLLRADSSTEDAADQMWLRFVDG